MSFRLQVKIQIGVSVMDMTIQTFTDSSLPLRPKTTLLNEAQCVRIKKRI